MNTKIFKTLIIMGVVTLVSLTSNAQQRQGRKKPPSPEKIIEKLDTDKDSKISRTEADADDRGKIKDNFKSIDKNKDDYITEEELKAFIEARKKSKKNR